MCSKNREIVMRGLELRKIKRQEEARQRAEAQKDAEQDVAERKMHDLINNHCEARRMEKEAAERIQQRDRQVAAARAARRAKEAKRSKNLEKYIQRNLGTVAAFAAVCTLVKIGAFAHPVAAVALALSCVYCVVNFIAYLTRNHKSGKRKEAPA